MDFSHFIQWGFEGLISGALIYGVSVLTNLKSSINILNERIATIIEKTAWHEKELEKHEHRIIRLESKV